MHPRVKSTVAGLVVVTAFVFGSALVGDPVPHDPAPGGRDEAAVALGASEGRGAGHRRRLHLTMPYVASRVVASRVAGSLLARGGES